MLNIITNYKLRITNYQKGFTLIELIVAIGILAILATFIMATLNPYEQFAKSQDARRKSDLSQVQKALEAYYQDNGRYPYSTTDEESPNYAIKSGEADNAIKAWGTSWGQYMQVLPKDSSGRTYVYYTDDATDNQSYWLYASLERGSKDIQACNSGLICTGVPDGAICGENVNHICNYGVSSTNVSP